MFVHPRLIQRLHTGQRRVTQGATTASRPVLHVDPHVPRDHVSARRRVRTLRTLVGFLPGVSAQVRVQVVAPTEHLATDVTLVGLETCVQAHVARKHVGARERAVANLAQVHLQDTRRYENLYLFKVEF